jgi:hypothetical protein
MALEYTNFFHSKALQNLPQLRYLVWKQTNWQPWASVLSPFTALSPHLLVLANPCRAVSSTLSILNIRSSWRTNLLAGSPYHRNLKFRSKIRPRKAKKKYLCWKAPNVWAPHSYLCKDILNTVRWKNYTYRTIIEYSTYFRYETYTLGNYPHIFYF